MSRLSVLVIDDERTLARAIRSYLEENGWEAEVAEDGETGLQMVERLRPDVVFLDVALPGLSGLEVLQRIRHFDAELPVVLMTAYGSIEGAVEAVKLGATDYLKKPVDLEELRLVGARVHEASRLRNEVAYYRGRRGRDGGEPVVAESAAMRAVMERVDQVAELEEMPPVLVTGETGTGKGLVARTIRSRSVRASRPFIEVNCTALPATLMEAELFGHERGAFTDARESKMGLFEAAEGGFLLLDEIGDLELSLQGKLLRAIEDRTVRRVGGVRDRRVDVRVMAATNRDLAREVEEGRFRKDLYYRLAVILIHIPALRERPDDVVPLARHFLARAAVRYGRPVREITSDAQELLRGYSWPGNVRELAHVVERAVLWSRGERLDTEALSLELRHDGRAGASDAASARNEGANGGAGPTLPSGGVDLAQVERSLIEQALREAGGNQTRAARLLGLTRDTLRYRLKKFGLG